MFCIYRSEFKIFENKHAAQQLWYIFIYISARSPLEKTRYDTSLGLLTKKFVGLLRNATDGVCIFYFMLSMIPQNLVSHTDLVGFI
jgi:hypothetical protein